MRIKVVRLAKGGGWRPKSPFKLTLYILNFLKISRVMIERPNIAMQHVREFSNFVRELSGNFISTGLWQT